MERLRWLPPISSGRRVAVNLADFKAYVFDGDSIAFETRAVVGKQFHETPMFTAMMTYVVINPYWNVPPSITRAEIMPKIKANPDYLAKNHMRIKAPRTPINSWHSPTTFRFETEVITRVSTVIGLVRLSSHAVSGRARSRHRWMFLSARGSVTPTGVLGISAPSRIIDNA